MASNDVPHVGAKEPYLDFKLSEELYEFVEYPGDSLPFPRIHKDDLDSELDEIAAKIVYANKSRRPLFKTREVVEEPEKDLFWSLKFPLVGTLLRALAFE